MSEQLRQLDQLKADYDNAQQALRVARASGQLDAIDAAHEYLMNAEAAYHDALYERAPGMSGDDRTAAARQLAVLHEARYRERVARERVDDLSQEYTADVIEEYQAAVDARRGLRVPEPPDAWRLDFEQERRADKERDAYEEAKREGFDGYER